MAERKNSTYYLNKEVSESIKKMADNNGISASMLAEEMLKQGLGSELDKTSRPCVITVLTNKGGTGKTTTSVNIAGYMAHAGNKVLLIDLDGQANASQYLDFIDIYETEPCIYDVLITDDDGRRMSLDDVMYDTGFDNFKLVPSSFKFNDGGARMDKETGVPRLDSRLQDAIEDLKEHFDYIIIDCPPALGTIATNAIAALDAGNPNSFILIPVQGARWAPSGLRNVIDTIESTCRLRRTKTHKWYCIKTLCDMRKNTWKTFYETVREIVGDLPWLGPVIPLGVSIDESTSISMPLAWYEEKKKKKSKPAIAYKELTDTILKMTNGKLE